MVSGPYRLKKVTRDFQRAISTRIKADKIILFGSRAYGKPHGHSDIDFAVISKDFSKMSYEQRIMLLSDLSRRVSTPGNVDIDVLGFTMREINEADYFDIAAEIRERGKVVYSR